MKRNELLRHLAEHGCWFLREGARHTIYWNSVNRKTTAIPRHIEIVQPLVSKICKDLGIPRP